MKTITIRELHHNTGEWVRKAAKIWWDSCQRMRQNHRQDRTANFDTLSTVVCTPKPQPAFSQN